MLLCNFVVHSSIYSITICHILLCYPRVFSLTSCNPNKKYWLQDFKWRPSDPIAPFLGDFLWVWPTGALQTTTRGSTCTSNLFFSSRTHHYLPCKKQHHPQKKGGESHVWRDPMLSSLIPSWSRPMLSFAIWFCDRQNLFWVRKLAFFHFYRAFSLSCYWVFLSLRVDIREDMQNWPYPLLCICLWNFSVALSLQLFCGHGLPPLFSSNAWLKP